MNMLDKLKPYISLIIIIVSIIFVCLIYVLISNIESDQPEEKRHMDGTIIETSIYKNILFNDTNMSIWNFTIRRNQFNFPYKIILQNGYMPPVPGTEIRIYYHYDKLPDCSCSYIFADQIIKTTEEE